MILRRHSRASLQRRFCTLLAALGLLFAATVASVTHSVAMPMMGMDSLQPMAAMDHHATQEAAAQDHGCDSMAAESDPAMPSGPCENGCLLCKSCSLASAVMPQPSSLAAVAPYRDYLPPAPVARAALAPTPPNEPPRP